MIPVLGVLVALALITGTCLWIGYRLHSDGPMWTPESDGEPSRQHHQ